MRAGRLPARGELTSAARALAVAGAACLVGVLGQLDRVVGFSATATVASAGGEPRWFPGHLRGYLPFVEGLGLWPAPNYRAIPPDLALTLGVCGGIAAAAVVYGALWWMRRRDDLVPLAAVAAIAIWLATRVSQGAYVNSKVLAVIAPLLLLVIVRPLMSQPERGRRRSLDNFTAGGAAVAALALGSASLPLRYASIGPLDHAREIASLRPALGDRPVLFAAKDNFVVWELLGANLSMADPYGHAFDSRVRVGFRPAKPRGVGSVTDFDSVLPSSLDRFNHLITSRSPFASRPTRFGERSGSRASTPSGSGAGRLRRAACCPPSGRIREPWWTATGRWAAGCAPPVVPPG